VPTVVASDGTPIYYEEWGRPDGEPLLMIQGLGADQRGWALQRLPFGRRFRCLALDNRGVGRSGRPPGPYSIVEMAADAVAVLDAAGVDTAHVMGASMGGVIAQVIGVAAPERVRSLVLACTACTHHEWRRELLAEWAAVVEARGMGALVPEGLSWLIGPRLRRRVGPWLNLLAPIVLQADAASFSAQVQAILDMPDDMKNELQAITAPTLVIVGSQDVLTPMGDSEELVERIPNARLVVLPGAAHGLMVESPIAYNAAVMEFLAEVSAETDATHPRIAAAGS